MQGCREGAQGFGEDHVGSAVEDAGNLGIAFDRHGGNGPFRAQFQELDAHLRYEGTHAIAGKPTVQLLRNAGQHPPLLRDLEFGRL